VEFSSERKVIGRQIVRYDEVTSTNDLAKRMAMGGAEDGKVIIATSQSKGRGRYGRSWFSPKGGLYLSILLRPKIRASQTHWLMFLAGVAVADAISSHYGKQVKIKWPNDILYLGKKLAGVMCECSSIGEKLNYVIVGIGINTNIPSSDFPEQLRQEATSLKEITGKSVNDRAFLPFLLGCFDRWYSQFPSNFSDILAFWKSKSNTIGKYVLIDDGTRGRALDIDSNGFLVLLDDSGIKKRIGEGSIQYLD